MMTADAADGAHEELLRKSEEYYARREVAWLTVLGVVLIVVAGAGTWMSRWETVEFQQVDVVNGRVVAVGYQCNTSSRLEAEEFDDRIEILLTERPPANNQDCYNARCVVLAEPLGDRRVINRGTGDEASIRQEVRGRAGCLDPRDGLLDW